MVACKFGCGRHADGFVAVWYVDDYGCVMAIRGTTGKSMGRDVVIGLHGEFYPAEECFFSQLEADARGCEYDCEDDYDEDEHDAWS